MRSLVYLLGMSAKNWFKQLLHKPGKLALYAIIVVMLLIALAASLFGATHNETFLPISYLLAIFFAFLVLFFVLAIKKGLSSGDSIFSMSDVNLLFVSPVNPRATLLYGLIQLAGMSFWAGFFILFQSSTLSIFGVGFNGVLILFVVFILTMMLYTLLSLVIYSATNGKPRRKRAVRIVAVVLFVPLVLFIIMRYLALGDPLLMLVDVAASPLFAATPLVGWAAAGGIALIEGNLLAGFGWLGLLLLSGAGMLAYLMFARSDYYEDVLVATETAFEKKRVAAEGDVQAAGSTTAKVKVGRTGLSGKGTQVFLSKHLRETFRKNRFGFLSVYMIIVTVATIGASLLLFQGDNILVVMQILLWMQVFMIGTGRGLMELYSHYIYMIPATPFSKAVWSNMELMARTLVESILFLGIPGVIMGSSPLVILGCMAVYILFSFMLLGVNYLSMRLTQASISQGILLMIYFIAVMLFMAPGVAGALVIGFSVEGTVGILLALLLLASWELVVALICFALSRNILHNCDMPGAKQKQ